MHLSETISSGFFFLAPWLVFAPLTGLLINLIFGRRLQRKDWSAQWQAWHRERRLSSRCCWLIRSRANHGEMVRWRLAEWIHIGTLNLDWTFRIDSLSTTMMLVVSGVGHSHPHLRHRIHARGCALQT